MIIPITWLKDYIKTTKSTKEIGQDFTVLGLMLDKPRSPEILDLEHRMDRADWLSITGCARDLAAYEKAEFKFPELYEGVYKKPLKNQLIDIKVNCPDLVKRFTTVTFRGITVKESPKWLKERLEAYGMPTINNIVDITNFVMVELGQPLHAQDLAKLEKPEIIIRNAKVGEQITTLLGENVELDPSVFVLTQNDNATVIGGIVGGNTTGVSSTTKDIILDAGNYNQNNIRKSSRKLKIMNETVMRTDKILDPRLTEIAIKRATKLILELAGGEVYENIDYYPTEAPLKQMTLRTSRIKQVGGIDITLAEAEKILIALDYKVLVHAKDAITVEVPYFRTDVEVEDDLVADVLRISSYNNIPVEAISATPPQEITAEIYKYEDKIKDICVKLGLYEHITDPIVQTNPQLSNQIVLENSLNADKTALRTNLYETLEPIIDSYRKHEIYEVGLFEIGKVYFKQGSGSKLEDYVEERHLEVIYANQNKSLVEINTKVKTLLSSLLLNLGIEVHYEKGAQTNLANIYNNHGDLIGTMRINSFTLFTEKLLATKITQTRVVQEMVNDVIEDISIICNYDQKIGPIAHEIKMFNETIKEVYQTDIYLDKTLGHNKKAVTLRIITNQKDVKLKEALIEHLIKTFAVDVRQQ